MFGIDGERDLTERALPHLDGWRSSRPVRVGNDAWHDRDAGAWPPGFPEAERKAYDLPEILRWLEVFCRRFFAFAQFKRSAMPNGPKVSAGGSLSPRGDWRAPSDSTAHAWLRDLDRWDLPGREG